MPDESRVLDLLADWEMARAGGSDPTPDDLCPDDPALREELRRRIARRDRRLAPILAAAAETPADRATAAGLPPPAPPGYVVEGELGRGGMGVVYLARQTALDRPVALKVLRADAAADAVWAARFRREAEAVARCRHPHVVQVHDFGSDAGRAYVALEYVDGGSLAKQLGGEPQPPAAAARLVETVARAVAAVHRAGVVHRDLKPANILVAADGTPKVTDFGLAKPLDATDGLTHTGAVFGTPSYMAPEQAAGTEGVGPPADVYGLGAVLYECLTGRPPFRGVSPVDTLLQVKTRDPVPPRQLVPSVPRDLETVCLKCLEKDPAGRYSTADDLADDLARFGRGEPVVARPVGRIGRAGRWCRRHPREAGLIAAVVVALVGGAGVSNVFRLRAEANATTAAANEGTAKEEAGRATDNLADALTALERVVRQAETDARRYGSAGPDRPAFLPAAANQRELIDLAVATYSRLVRSNGRAPDARYQAARAWMNLRAAHTLRREPAAARDAARNAVGMLQGLCADAPDRRDYAAACARACDEYGVESFGAETSADPEPARAPFEEAARRWSALLAAEPETPEWMAGLAEARYHLAEYLERSLNIGGQLAAWAGRFAVGAPFPLPAADPRRARAKAAYDEADRLLADLFRLGPVAPPLRGLTARVCNSMADFYLFKLNRDPLPMWEKTIAVLDPVVARPDLEFRFRNEYLFAVHNLLMNFQNPEMRGYDPAKARALLAKAIPVAEQVARETYPNAQPMNRLSGLLHQLASAVKDTDPTAAAAAYGRAIRWFHRKEAVSGGPPTADPYLGLAGWYAARAECLGRARRPAEALADWEAAVGLLEIHSPAEGLTRGQRLQIVAWADYLHGTVPTGTAKGPAPSIDPRRGRAARLVAVTAALDPAAVPTKEREPIVRLWEATALAARSNFDWAAAAAAMAQALRFSPPTLPPADRARHEARRAFDLDLAGRKPEAYRLARDLGDRPDLPDQSLFDLILICGRTARDGSLAADLRAEAGESALRLLTKLLDRPYLTAAVVNRVGALADLAYVRQLPGYADWKGRADAKVQAAVPKAKK